MSKINREKYSVGADTEALPFVLAYGIRSVEDLCPLLADNTTDDGSGVACAHPFFSILSPSLGRPRDVNRPSRDSIVFCIPPRHGVENEKSRPVGHTEGGTAGRNRSSLSSNLSRIQVATDTR